MRLEEKEILKIITDYIDDSQQKHAVLIDGSWGVGKTYFIKKKLIDKWDKEDTPVLYISLYGMNDILEVEKEIYTLMFADVLKKTIGLKDSGAQRKVMSILSKLGSATLQFLNIDKENIPEIKDLKDIEKSVVVFDDLERCTIDIDVILGFINNLVEHKKVKAILIGNEKEIGIGEEAKEKFYNKIKEKLVGYTLHYEPNFCSVYDSIIEAYDENKEFFKENKDFIIRVFVENEHYNLRTLKFALHCCHKILKVLNSIEFDSEEYIDREKKLVLKYLLESSIQLKSGKKPYAVQGSNDIGSIYRDGNIKNVGLLGYRFVDSLLQYGYIDEENIKNVILTHIEDLIKIDREYEDRNGLALFKFNIWWELEEDDITAYLNQLKKELESDKYLIIHFKEIILLLMRMKKYGFDEIKIEEYVKLMEENLLKENDNIDRELLKVFGLDSETTVEYNSIVSSLFVIIDKKNKHNYIIDNNQILGKDLDDSFTKFCFKNRDHYLLERKFMYYFDIDMILERMKTSRVKGIYNFRSGLESVYSFSNINEFFKDDIDNLKNLITRMDIEDLSNGSRTKKIALENLKEWLGEKLEILKS